MLFVPIYTGLKLRIKSKKNTPNSATVWVMIGTMKAKIKSIAKSLLLKLLPLSTRKTFAIKVGQLKWISNQKKGWWAQELVKDMRENNINEYHKFLWANHLSYAESYEIESRFGIEKLKGSRKLLFNDAAMFLDRMGINRETDIQSVMEVGCSLGYLLRYMEKYYFPSAKHIIGIDIDKQAIIEGKKYLKSKNSIIELKLGDMESLDKDTHKAAYDAIFCLGVLMYLTESEARKVIGIMLNHTKKVLILSGLAHPDIDNRELKSSVTRKMDNSLIHNFDLMVESEGGEVLFRRWGGNKLVDNNSIYFVFARPKK